MRTILCLLPLACALVCAPAHAGEADPPPAPGLPAPDTVPWLGVVSSVRVDGVVVARVVPGSPAEVAGLQRGDVVISVAGEAVDGRTGLAELLSAHAPGDAIGVRVERDGRTVEARAVVGGRNGAEGVFRGRAFRLAVVPIRFPDEAASRRDGRLDELLFERTGRRGAGASVADYYDDQSHGRLRMSGRVFAPVTVQHPRAHYAPMLMGGRSGTLFAEAAAAVATREGVESVTAYNGLAFVYDAPSESRSGLALWPHRSTVTVGSRRMAYYVHPVGEPEGDTIGVHCHEFGHLLGLPDQYGVGHRTGAGDFCLMALGHRGAGEADGRAPFSVCAHCRMRLGWLRPRVVDPRRMSRVTLQPAGDGVGNAVVLPMDRRTEEYLLLEVRSRSGFDSDLPTAGLLVWHVGGQGTPGQGPYAVEVDLVEAHGIDTFDASLVRPEEAAFPTARARDLTPTTVPSVLARAGGFPVHLTTINRSEDGSVSFTVGARRHVDQPDPFPYVRSAPERDGAVVRRDPITGRNVRFYPRSLQRPAGIPSSSSSGNERR